jgi:hypothetical protein
MAQQTVSRQMNLETIAIGKRKLTNCKILCIHLGVLLDLDLSTLQCFSNWYEFH